MSSPRIRVTSPSAAPADPIATDAVRPDLLAGLAPAAAEQQKLLQMRLAGVEITIFAPPPALAATPD
ncbi:hypothetical protein [Ferrovibrio sp.]|uniref:hypothetical protein n=1 Tax=Ferrovibrio sp. TaxID=1917215 RepID=UPI0035B253A7